MTTTITLEQRSNTIECEVDMSGRLRVIPDQVIRLGDGGSLRAFGPALRWLLRDLFSTASAAGSVNSTAAEPGPGTRAVTDAENKVSITGGKLHLEPYATPGEVAPRFSLNTLARAAGRVVLGRGTVTSFGTANNGLGWDNDAAGSPAIAGILFRATTALRVYDNSSVINVGVALSTVVNYDLAVVLRSTGAFYYITGGVYAYPTLIWISTTGTTTPLYPAINCGGNVMDYDHVGVPDALWLPVPLASDSFNRSDGALGSTDGAGHAEANGGSGVAWAATTGTWSISTNKAAISALDGGLALATLTSGKANAIVDAKITRAGGVAGIVARYVDASNYVIAYHDGTNVKLDKVVGGVVTNLISAAATYSAGAVLRVVADGASFEIYYNNARVGTGGTVIDAALQTSTVCGLYSTNAGNTFDDFTVWARGTAGEYSALQSFFQ